MLHSPNELVRDYFPVAVAVIGCDAEAIAFRVVLT
jgi:hypothetical protein